MKSTLYLKFILIYIVFGFLSFFTVEALTLELIKNQNMKDESENIYRQASVATQDYLPAYFQGKISTQAVKTQLDAMKNYLKSSLWFVKPDGTLITASYEDGSFAPQKIENFDPAEFGAKVYAVGDYHGYFGEDVVTVISPVTKGFTTKGYLLIHKPLSLILLQADKLKSPIYITLAAILALSFLLLLAVRFFVYRPLMIVTDAAKQYALGNLTYEIPIKTNDEFGELSASLNYMSSQLRDMQDYQKQIVANVSHDFRSPLTSISGYLKAMADGVIPPDKIGKYLDIILFETERLSDLTKDLLTLNEFDTKGLLLDKTDFDIQELIKKTAASFERECTLKKISLDLLLLLGKAMVFADFRKIGQVLYNLIDNAVKFSDNGSSVAIEVTEKGEKYLISVKDSGIGIPKKDLNKIWERFYKSDSSRGRDKKGTGLGLPIVKEVLNAHGEYITVVSTKGVGTEFIFSLSKAKTGIK